MLLNPQETADWVTFNEESLNRKRHFLCSVAAEEILSHSNTQNCNYQ